MKSAIKKMIPLATVLALGVAGPARAVGLADLLYNDIPTGVGVKTLDTTLNGARATTSWNDNNGNGVFDLGDTMASSFHVYDRNGVQVLGSGPASIGWNDAQLEQWAIDNGLIILQAMFPSGLSEVTGATDDDMMASATASRNLFRKAGRLRKNAGKGKGTAQNKGETAEQEEEQTQEVRAEVEYLDLKVAENSGNAYSMIMGYANESDSGLEFSLSIPYRYSTMKDDLSSTSHFVGLDFSLNYPVKKWDKSELRLGGDIFGSAFYLKNDNIDKSGNLKYGGGLFTSVDTDLGFGNLGVGVDYKIAKAYLPSSMISDNSFLDIVVDYLNDLDPVHTVSYGFNLGVPVGEVAAVNLEVIRASFVSGDVPDGQKNRTTAGLSGSYFPSDTFELNMGVRADFELEGVDSVGVMLGVVHKF